MEREDLPVGADLDIGVADRIRRGLDPDVEASAREIAELEGLCPAFVAVTRSLFTYYSTPDGVLSVTPLDEKIAQEFLRFLRYDDDTADLLADLIRARGAVPPMEIFPDVFTRWNYLTFTSLCPILVEEMRRQKRVAAAGLAQLPAGAAQDVRDALERLRAHREEAQHTFAAFVGR
jgi:hypothetical protein